MIVVVCDDDAAVRVRYLEHVALLARKLGIDMGLVPYATAGELVLAMDDVALEPDIVILDVMTPGSIDGFEAARIMRAEGFEGAIIYLSSSQEHCLKAFKVKAHDFVVKGEVSESVRFEEAFLKAVGEMIERRAATLLIHGLRESRKIRIDAVRYFEVKRHIVSAHFAKGDPFHFSASLGDIEQKVAAFGFVRLHRSYVANCAAIARFSGKGVVLEDGTELPVGRMHYPRLRAIMGSYATVRF